MFRLNRVFWCWVFAAGFAYVVGVSTASATVPGQNGKIVFSIKDNDIFFAGDLFTVNPDGTEVKRLTSTPEIGEHDPAVSPDGSKIVFERVVKNPGDFSEGASFSDLYTMNIDGSGTELFLSSRFGSFKSDPDWSPDGSKILFGSSIFPGGAFSLDVVNLVGGKVFGDSSPVVQDQTASAASWSPDGKKFVFGRDNFSPDRTYINTDIIVVNADGSNPQVITSLDKFRRPIWSPDGTKFLLTNYDNSDIAVMNVDGSGIKSLGAKTSILAKHPIWSPDGKQIAYVQGDDAVKNAYDSIWVMNADGTNQHQLLDAVATGVQKAIKSIAWQAVNSPFVRGECNGVGCSDNPRLLVDNESKVLSGLKKPVGFTKSGFVVSGKLLNQSGQPIGGATIDVLQQVASPGSVQAKVSEVKTDANGVWKATVGSGSSRSVQFAYRAYVKDEKYAVVSTAFMQKVRGAVSFKLPKRAKRGKKLVLQGSLAGGFVPAQGKVVELQVFYKRKYRVFKTLRTDAKGVFRFRFAFGRSYRPGVYRLRVNVRSEPAWPFLAAVSKTRKIKVG